MRATGREIRVLDGNRAAAWGVLLCRPDVIAAYPITPQTPLLEALYRFKAEGRLEAEMVEVEGENSALSVLIGAAAAGGRTFTATSSQGLALMYEAYYYASGQRLPIVIAVASREQVAPNTVSSGQQDVVGVKDAGWVQLHMESCQEILDTVITAYRLAEDPEVLLPVTIVYDGYYLSHLSEPVVLPSQEAVNAFLGPPQPRLTLDPEKPLTFAAFILGPLYTEYRYKHVQALERAKAKLEEIEAEFARAFGRSYGGQLQEYRMEDAELVLVAMGSAAGTAKLVVDRMREQGVRMGLVRVRMFRPFPRERLAQALRGRQAVGVLDRNVCFGWGCGHLFMEVKGVLGEAGIRLPVANFIDGLAGTDITIEHLERAAGIVRDAARGQPFPAVTWLAIQ